MFREVTAAIKQLTQSSSAASVKTIAVGVCPSLEGLPYSKPQSWEVNWTVGFRRYVVCASQTGR